MPPREQLDSNASKLAWLKQSPSTPNGKHLLEHIDSARVELKCYPLGVAAREHKRLGSKTSLVLEPQGLCSQVATQLGVSQNTLKIRG
jgi:hypothetical protein